jgi:hypothetical protein
MGSAFAKPPARQANGTYRTYERTTKNPLARLSLTINHQSPITNHIPYPTSYFAIAFQETRRKILRAHLDPFVNHR